MQLQHGTNFRKHELRRGGLHYCPSISRFEDGRLDEIFISNHKVGSPSVTNATDAALAARLGLQHRCPFDVLRVALLRDMGGKAATPLRVSLDLVVKPQRAPRVARHKASPFYLGAHGHGRGRAQQS